MTFANHFDKHGVRICPPDKVNAETYLRLANKHVTQGQARVTLLLSQDGTALKHTYEYDEKIAVVIEDVKNGDGRSGQTVELDGDGWSGQTVELDGDGWSGQTVELDGDGRSGQTVELDGDGWSGQTVKSLACCH
nr:Biomphalaria glabrata proline-rich protein 36-like [Biomphalaria glabrata]